MSWLVNRLTANRPVTLITVRLLQQVHRGANWQEVNAVYIVCWVSWNHNPVHLPIVYIRSQVLTLVKKSMTVFWVVTHCGLVGACYSFGTHPQALPPTASIFIPEDGGKMFFRNVGIHQQVHTASQPNGPPSTIHVTSTLDNLCLLTNLSQIFREVHWHMWVKGLTHHTKTPQTGRHKFICS
jgi:hypothetical protein